MTTSDSRLLGLTLLTFSTLLNSTAHAVEEGQLVKKDGRWEDVSAEDPGLKYLLLKGIITQSEYERGAQVLETKAYL